MSNLITSKDHFNLRLLSRVYTIYGSKYWGAWSRAVNEALNRVQMTVKIFLQIL